MPLCLQKILSGGQTGADRAALDWALAHHLPHGGWCPKGRLAEDGPIPPRYHLQETPTDHYAQRTEWNVRDSDGTVILSMGKTLIGGSKTTAEFAQKYHQPWLHLNAESDLQDASYKLRDFIATHAIQVLNVAGPRASDEPGIAEFVHRILNEALPH